MSAPLHEQRKFVLTPTTWAQRTATEQSIKMMRVSFDGRSMVLVSGLARMMHDGNLRFIFAETPRLKQQAAGD
jgi:hypothetical protein